MATLFMNYWWEQSRPGMKKIKNEYNYLISATIAILMVYYTPDLSYYFLNESYEFGEELVKAISIWAGGYITLLYTPLFALIEAVYYISIYYLDCEINYGTGMNFVLFRIVAALEHCIWLVLHIIGYRYAKKQKSRTIRIFIRCATFLIVYQLHLIHNEWFGLWLFKSMSNF